MTDRFLDDGAHLDLDGLADHLAGEVDASAHLATCGGCTARLAELEAADRLVIATLRSLDDPPLPADVADRLTAAFAAESPRVAARAVPAPTATVTPIGPARDRRRAWLPSVAAAALLAFGGLIGYGVVSGSGGSDDSASDSAAPASAGSAERAQAFPTVASGLDYADTAAVAASLPRVLDGSAGAGLADSQLPDAAVSAPSGSLVTPPPAADDAPAAADPLARLREPAALADCLAAVLDPANPAEQPLALDYATYAGAPALAIVLPDADPAKVSVFVVGPDCSRADDDLAFFTRLDRA